MIDTAKDSYNVSEVSRVYALGKLYHIKYSDGCEVFYEYPEDENKIGKFVKYPNGLKVHFELDLNYRVVHEKRSDGTEYWYEYNSSGEIIRIKDAYNNRIIMNKKKG